MPEFAGERESGNLLSGRQKSMACALGAGVLVAFFICEKELLNTRVTVFCKKGCI